MPMDILASATDPDDIFSYGNICTKRSKLISFYLASRFVSDKLFEIFDNGTQNQFFNEFSFFTIKLYCNLKNLVMMKESSNALSTSRAPPVLPHELTAVTPRDFYSFFYGKKRLS